LGATDATLEARGTAVTRRRGYGSRRGAGAGVGGRHGRADVRRGVAGLDPRRLARNRGLLTVRLLAVRLLARKFQLSGFHGLDFVLDEDTDAAYLLELNPRATQLGHLNLSPHGDLAGVMAGKLKNEAPDRIASENQIQDSAIAFFPYALKSDPGSAYLHQGYHDVPWDQPALVRELLCDPWPERQWPSRIYQYLGFRKKLAPERKVYQPIDAKVRP